MAISTGEQGKGRVNADINVTPMIDVMLVLLIIFMIVTPLLASGFKATMPTGKNVDIKAEEDGEITLGIDNVGAFFIDGQPVPEEQVVGKLTELFAARPDYHIIHFKADQNLEFGQVQKGIEMARKAGASNLIAIADKRGGLSGDKEAK